MIEIGTKNSQDWLFHKGRNTLEPQNQKSDASHQPERRTYFREVVAGQARF
jgi:hypothetical protein